jgi:hypothetical protein
MNNAQSYVTRTASVIGSDWHANLMPSLRSWPDPEN